MKTLLKRLFGIQRLEDELAGMWAELEATKLALLTERMRRRAYIDKTLEERRARFGPWKAKKDGKGFYRKVTYPNSMPSWRTESAQSLPNFLTAAGCGLPCDGFGKEIKEPDYVLEDRACRNPFYEDANDEIKAVLAH